MGYQWRPMGSAFRMEPSGFGRMQAENVRKLEEIEALRQRLMKPLTVLREKIRVCNGRELVMALYEYLKEAQILEQLKKQDSQEVTSSGTACGAFLTG